MLRGNPLLHLAPNASFNLKRRWDDDVVFKNQVCGAGGRAYASSLLWRAMLSVGMLPAVDMTLLSWACHGFDDGSMTVA